LEHQEKLRHDLEPSVDPRSPVRHRATEDHTKEYCTHHSVSAEVNLDLPGDRHLITIRREEI